MTLSALLNALQGHAGKWQACLTRYGTRVHLREFGTQTTVCGIRATLFDWTGRLGYKRICQQCRFSVEGGLRGVPVKLTAERLGVKELVDDTGQS